MDIGTGKRKARFNFLDALLILAVITLIAGVIWREELSDRIKTENIENTVTVCCEINALADSEGVYTVEFEEGRTAVWAEGKEAGYVETLSALCPEQPAESGGESGESAAPAAPQTLRGTRLYLKVVSRESGYYINGETKLFIGGEYRMNTKTVEFTVQILSLREEPDAEAAGKDGQ